MIPTHPLIFAHRGGALEAPENSIAAFRRAAALGVDGIETDLRASSDGLVVLHHDPDLVLPDGRIVPITAMEGEEIAVLRPDVPTLAAALSAVRNPLCWMLELKPTLHQAALLSGLQVVLRHLNAQVLLASSSAPLLKSATALMPALPLIAIVQTEAELAAFEGLRLRAVAAELHCATALARKTDVWAWTQRQPGELAALRAAGVKGLITDTPRATLSALSSSRAAEA